MEKRMRTLREELYITLRKNDWTLTRMSIECGISYRELQNILYNQSKDIRLSTLSKISEGTGKPISSLIG